MPTPSILSQIEAILFVSGEPLSLARLSKILELPRKEVETALTGLKEHLSNDSDSGLFLIQNADSVELATKGEHAHLIEALTKSTLQENLSRAALEVLSIIAYRAPVTRSHIESIRGVNCSFTLRNLLLRGLVERSGNPEDAREYVYAPSFLFLERLGVGSVKALPDFESLSQDERLHLVTEETEKNT
ncbi:MAG: SMC-Scp complex subunit ScpB [Candidatus Moraniibacteriota bacterium]